ncbi:MAG TPA: hypothetical protein VGL29_13300, partial [Blastocatellia bacterium]
VGIGTISPQAKLDVGGELDVRGDVKLGSSGQLFAPGGPENLRIIRGVIGVNGDIIAGSGFSVIHNQTGVYLIRFDTAFSDTPAFTAAAQMHVDGPDHDDTETVMFTSIASFGVDVRIQDQSGFIDSAQFSFIAIGRR